MLSNGTSLTSAINITTSQSGAGNLYVATRILTLNVGTTFGGTGGIYSDPVPGNAVADTPLSNSVSSISGAGPVSVVFNVNGTLNGVNTVSLNVDTNVDSGIAVGANGVIGGTQTWNTRGATVNGVAFANSQTDPTRWTNGAVSYTHNASAGTFEAATSSISPDLTGDYRFNSFSIISGNTQAGAYKLTNAVQNDGGSAKEALFATNYVFSVGDGSGGRIIFNLNGQDLYAPRFNNINGISSSGLILQNDAANSVSDIRALGTAGDTLIISGYQVLNGATLEIIGGNYNNIISGRSIGVPAADTAAAPNASVGPGGNSQSTLAFNNTTANVGNTNFLGSGNDKGTTTATTGSNTGGTFRVVGGSYTTSSYVLNPVGVVGLIDTTDGGVSPVADSELNKVTIRGAASLAITVDATTDLITPSTTGIYNNGDPVRFTAGTFPGGLAVNTTYYVVGLDPVTGKFGISATPGGAAIDLTSAGTLPFVQDVAGASVASDFPALIVAGTTTVNGHLALVNAPGAVNQATLRVGGDVATASTSGPTVHAGTGSLTVTGDLTTQAGVNVAIQSNGSVRVGGNVSIAGVGTNISYASSDVTGRDGVGINAASNFTLNGNKGAATPQTVSIVPAVGKFHVGDGTGGTLTGTAAQAVLTQNLTVAGNSDINGPDSRLNLGGKTLTLTGGSELFVGGRLEGTGTIAGGALTIGSGGTISPGNSPGTMTTAAQTWAGGGAYQWELNSATGTAGADPGWDLLTIGGALNITATTGNKFTIQIYSLTPSNTAGNVADFGGSTTYQFLIADSTSTIAFDPSAFTLDTSHFSNPTGGPWMLVRGDSAGIIGGDATQLYLTVVPEPGAFAMVLGGAAYLGLWRRSRSRRRFVS